MEPCPDGGISPKWDLRVQSPHGGQEWRELTNFVDDFSVTTNFLGTPNKALEAAKREVSNMDHYPPADFEPAISSLAQFLVSPETTESQTSQELRGRMLLGNGASELIDLCIREAPGEKWRTGGWDVQYMEYQRSSENCGRTRVASDNRNGELFCIVNPCNPTGDYFSIDLLKAHIEANTIAPPTNDAPDTQCPAIRFTVIVDESMQPWVGPMWRQDSVVPQTSWVRRMRSVGVAIYVIHSWTKIWCCTGLRLGSLVCPSKEEALALKKKQVPWSVNNVALAFLDAVVRDSAYLAETWELTPIYRAEIVRAISAMHPDWKFHGKPFLSYIWIDTGSAVAAEAAVEKCRRAGTPIRWGKYGYDRPSFIRVAVRKPQSVKTLLEALHD